MLDAFRQKGLTSIVYGAVIVATVVVFVVEFRPGGAGQSGSLKQTCAAEVRGNCIDPRDFGAELALVAPPRMVEASQVRAMGLRRIVLDGMVERTLLERDADRLGITVAEDELSDELIAGRAHVSLPADKAPAVAYSLRLTDDLVRLLPVDDPDTKQFDLKIYERVVRQFSGRSPTEFREMQRKELLAARMRDLVRSRARVSEQEALDAFLREKSTATVRFVRFHRDWFARHALDLSPAAVEAWAKAHEEEVGKVFEARKSQYLPECRMAEHILVKVAEGATDEEKAEARKKIEAAAARIKNGESFESVAREVSDDTSAAEGGSLGCVPKGKTVKPFEDALYALEPGQVSGVVESQFGLHLIKLDAVYKDADAEAQGRRETARALMVGKEGETLAAETAKKVLAAAKGGQKLDDALAEALAALPKPGDKGKAKKDAGKADANAKSSDDAKPAADENDDARPRVEVSGAFTSAGDPVPGASSGQSVAGIAFALAKEGDLPDDLVKLDDGYAVMQLKEKTAATREQFDKDRETYMAALLAAKQAEALNEYVERLRASAKGDIKINELYANPPHEDRSGEDE